MNFSTVLPGSLLTIAIASTIAVGLAVLATFLLRKSSAALRHWLWLLALIVPLVTLPLASLNLRITLPVLPAAPIKSAISASTPSTIEPHEPTLSIPPTPSLAASVEAPSPPPITINLCLALWLLGSFALLVHFVLSHLRLRRLLRQPGPLPSPALRQAMAETRQHLQVRRPVRLLLLPSVAVPFCHGLWRPSVVLPKNAAQWPEQQLRICLAHELAHLKRHDLLALLLGHLACTLCWFNPLVWFAAARLREEAEKSADDLVLSGPIPPTTYAASLVAMAENYQAFSSAALTMARPHRLTTRVNAILDSSVHRLAPSRATTLALGCLAFCLLTSALAIRLTAAPTVPSPYADIDFKNLSSRMQSGVWDLISEAITAGDLKTVETLLDRGLDVNGGSFLYLAVDRNQLPIVQLLLARRADVNRKSSWGDTPIKRACLRGHKEIADILIAAGAPVNALHYAVGLGDLPALIALDQQKPLAQKQVRSLLDFALSAGRENTFSWLWTRLAPMDNAKKEELLGDLYENAGKWGQLGILRHLESLGATPAKYGRRALTQAVSQNHPGIVRHLLEHGVSPNAPKPGWSMPLRDAAGQGRFEIVNLLLEHKANPNLRDHQGLTPLSWAASNGNEEICLLLLKYGADGNIEDEFGKNAAWYAAGGMHCPRTLEALIKKGVKLTGRDKIGQLLFNSMMRYVPPSLTEIGYPGKIYTAPEIRDYEERERRTIDLLVAAGLDFNGQPGTETPLMAAIETGHHAAARALLAHGADVSIKDERGHTALVTLFGFPGKNHPLSLLEALLKAGADPNAGVKFWTDQTRTFPLLEQAIGYAPGFPAQTKFFREAIKMLLDHGATFPTDGDAKTQTLLIAAARGDLPALQRAISGGTSLDASDMNGWTPLIITLALGYDECANWLLRQGANVNTRTRQRYTPLSVVTERGQTALVQDFINKGARPDDGDGGLYTAVEQNNQRLFDALINSGANVNGGNVCTITDSNGMSYRMAESILLYLCIKNGNPAMARTLLEKGADPDPANLRENRNLVYWAVHYNQPEILRALLARGANPALPDSTGQTPLLLAQKSHQDLVPILEQALNEKR